MLDIDAKDFRILDEIYRSKSVSGAVERVGLGQPSISIRLGKLREHFRDPLFVRTSSGMQATPRLEALIPAIREALALCDGRARGPQPFDPAATSRSFRICMTDSGQTVILPRLLARLGRVAPRIRIETINLDMDAARLLEAGEADIAMGFTLDIPAPFYQQRLFEERFVCTVRKAHPRLDKKLTRRQFLAEQHIEVVLPRGTGHWILNKALDDQGIERDVALRVPSFLGVASIVTRSDLVALVPVHLGRLLAEGGQVKLLDPPMPLPTYQVRQYWHERYHRDPANQWLRTLVGDLFAEPATPEAPGR